MPEPDTPNSHGLVVSPSEMSSLISESAGLMLGLLLGCGAFAALAWFTAAVAWLHAAAIVLAIVLGLRGLWHAVFLIRAALRFRDELDLAIEQAEADDTRRGSFLADDPWMGQ